MEQLKRIGEFTLITSPDDWRRYTIGAPDHLKVFPEQVKRMDDACEPFLVRTTHVFGASGTDEETHLIVTPSDARQLLDRLLPEPTANSRHYAAALGALAAQLEVEGGILDDTTRVKWAAAVARSALVATGVDPQPWRDHVGGILDELRHVGLGKDATQLGRDVRLLIHLYRQLTAERKDTLATLQAILHQLDHGEASDLLGDTFQPDYESWDAAVRDLAWCRDQLQMVTTDPTVLPIDLDVTPRWEVSGVMDGGTDDKDAPGGRAQFKATFVVLVGGPEAAKATAERVMHYHDPTGRWVGEPTVTPADADMNGGTVRITIEALDESTPPASRHPLGPEPGQETTDG